MQVELVSKAQNADQVFYGPAGPRVLLLLLLLRLLLLRLLLLLSGPFRHHLMAHGRSIVGHVKANNVSTVRTYCHMLGSKTSPENPSSNLFPNISGFTEKGSEAQKVGNTFCNIIFVTPFTYCAATKV
jgi:hypothetical protein